VKRKYGFLEGIILFLNLLKTKFLFPTARLIRFPIDIRGKKFIEVNRGFTTGVGCRIEAYPVISNIKVIKIGNNVQINDYVHITGVNSVEIEDNVLIASKVYISDCSHGNYSGEVQSSPNSIVKDRNLSYKSVLIKKNAWLGENVAILPGVIIGENSIVGANSVVTKNIPDNVIAAGNPCKIIKKYNFETQKWEKTDNKGEFLDEK
jgi:acetyltransferase-like isoleucine patch superfamily enzyme